MRVTLTGSQPRRLPDQLRYAALALAFAGAHVLAQAFAPPEPKLLPPEQAFRLSARALDPSTIEARFDVADGYYLYRDKLRFSVSPGSAAPAVLPPGKAKHDEFFGDVEIYRGVVAVRLPIASVGPGQVLTLSADSQGCADAGVCYPPTREQVQLTLPERAGKPGPFVEPARSGWFK